VSSESFDAVFGDSTHPSVYVYTRDGEGFRSRMFFPAPNLTEDPATGSAAASFAGALMQFEPLGEGEHNISIRQGVEMGRPSDIALQLTIRQGALVSAEIGGGAVVISRGELLL
jgi:trans-2,3-dihydro-3-hydroxyanthranilate isomerase